MPRLHLDDLNALITRALERAGASAPMARATAAHLVEAEAQGLQSHGLSRTPQYCAHLDSGRADGRAAARIIGERGGAALIDAGDGLAFEACAFAVEEGMRRAREHGVAFASVTRSNHFGVAALHLMPLERAGLIGIACGNSPAAIAAWGGRRALFGTNPVAALFPRRNAPALVIDLSLSQAARGKVLVAARRGEPIPADWAFDAEGQPTTDAQAALGGTMAPAGGVKGAMLALIVELLCVALTGAQFGFEADSYFGARGNRPRVGQAFLVIDPEALAGREIYLERVETLIEAMLAEPGVRLPGERRRRLAEAARRDGVEVDAGLEQQVRELAADR